MAQIEGEIVIDRPIDEVFDFVADEGNEPQYNPKMLAVEQLSDGEIGLGTKFRAEVKSGRRVLPVVIEFTAYDRPVRLGSRTRMSGMLIVGELRFEEVGEATRMRWSWRMEPSGAFRLLKPLIVLLGRRQERGIWEGLKRRLEA